MLKKEMTYKDFNGVERTEVFCFHLSEAELMQEELETEGGFKGLLKKLMDAKDTTKMVKIFKEIIDRSYGELSADGKYFTKTPEALLRFKSTQAYNDLYMSLLNDEEAAKFINAVIPSIPLSEEDKAEVEKIKGELKSNSVAPEIIDATV